LNNLLGYEFSAFVVAAIGQISAHFFEDDVHIRLNTLVKFAHTALHRDGTERIPIFHSCKVVRWEIGLQTLVCAKVHLGA
jgi:hypothetical protein